MTAGSRTAKVTLPTDDQIQITRTFDAPAALVYRAMTTPELVSQTRERSDKVRSASFEADFRVGGAWRSAMVTLDGEEVALHGTYVEIVPNEKLVTSEVYEGLPEGVDADIVATATFVETDGQTTMTLVLQTANQTARDAIMATGLENGVQDGLNLTEATIAGLS